MLSSLALLCLLRWQCTSGLAHSWPGSGSLPLPGLLRAVPLSTAASAASTPQSLVLQNAATSISNGRSALASAAQHANDAHQLLDDMELLLLQLNTSFHTSDSLQLATANATALLQSANSDIREKAEVVRSNDLQVQETLATLASAIINVVGYALVGAGGLAQAVAYSVTARAVCLQLQIVTDALDTSVTALHQATNWKPTAVSLLNSLSAPPAQTEWWQNTTADRIAFANSQFHRWQTFADGSVTQRMQPVAMAEMVSSTRVELTLTSAVPTATPAIMQYEVLPDGSIRDLNTSVIYTRVS